jgi:hypothetical protein
MVSITTIISRRAGRIAVVLPDTIVVVLGENINTRSGLAGG